MNLYKFTLALEDIYYKYERMQALASVLQQFTAECVDIVGAPENAVRDSLFEIELGLGEANEKLKELICNGAGQASRTNEANGNGTESETERLRRYIYDMASQIRSEKRLRQIYTAARRSFINDRLEVLNERQD